MITNILFLAHGFTFEQPVQVILHYLQFCYYQLGDVANAGNASLSKLTLSPDQLSTEHYEYYQTKYGSIFSIRPDINFYLINVKKYDNLANLVKN